MDCIPSIVQNLRMHDYDQGCQSPCRSMYKRSTTRVDRTISVVYHAGSTPAISTKRPTGALFTYNEKDLSPAKTGCKREKISYQ